MPFPTSIRVGKTSQPSEAGLWALLRGQEGGQIRLKRIGSSE